MFKSSGMLAGVIMFGMAARGFGQQAPAVHETPTVQSEKAANDPLQCYRGNPELMKRYFPQLYRAQMGQQTQAAAPSPDGTPAPTIPEIRFGGGTAQALADLLKQAVQPPPNIMISPGMKDAAFPAFELHNVT